MSKGSSSKVLVLGAATVGGVMIYSGLGGVNIMDVLAGKASLKDANPQGGDPFSPDVPSASTGGSQTESALHIAGQIPGADLKGKTPKQIIDVYVLPVARKHKIAATPQSVEQANARHGPTITGGHSDHQGPPNVAWAADLSGGVGDMNSLAKDLARLFGIRWHGAGLVNASHDGFRFQLIHNTMIGGNHFNHVHFGVHTA